MPVLKYRRPALVALGAIVVLSLCSSQAFAGYGHDGSTNGSESDTSASAGVNGDKVSAGASAVIVFDRSKNGRGRSAGAVTSTTSWAPPACYYAPKHSPKELEAQMRQVWESSAPSPSGP